MNIVIMATNGYGHKFSANNAKCEFIALGLKKIGCKVAIINQLTGTEGVLKFTKAFSDCGIEYYDFPVRDLLHIESNVKIYRTLLKDLFEEEKKNHIIIGFNLYPIFWKLCNEAKNCGYSRSTLFHEWHIGLKNEPVHRKIDYYLIDKMFGYSLDYIFPISHYLSAKAERFKKPTMILPVMATYDRETKNAEHRNSFCLCANAAYLVRNSLILDAFKIVLSKFSTVNLVLVLFGQDAHISCVIRKTKELGIADNVIIKSQIPQAELYEIYDTSVGLLIPLQPDSLQDIARFSQKIAEYVGSKRPIITSKVGEIPYYFEHKKSAMIAEYSPEGYAKCMLELLENEDMANTIGENGYNVGLSQFDSIVNAKRIVGFLNNR